MASLGGGSGSPHFEDGRHAAVASVNPDVGIQEHDESTGDACSWRTTQFHNQECSRFFDCPSHVVERRLSIDEDNDPAATIDEHLTADNETDSDEQALQEHTLDDGELASSSSPRAPSPGPTPQPSQALASGSSPSPQPLSTEDMDGISTARQQLGQLEIVSSESDSEPESSDLYQDSDDDQNHSDASDGSPASPSAQRPTVAVHGSDMPVAPSSAGGGTRQHDSSSRPLATSESELAESTQDFVLPRWQSDAEVTYCPICKSQFSIFVRKHHCRKCGRVVCNSCSPHRIIIPHQYIVRPPGSEIPLPQSLLIDGFGGGYFDINGLSGGERVRLCNPCVPDPNTAPPRSPASPPAPSPRITHQRSRSSFGNMYGAAPHPNRYGTVFASGSSQDPYRYYPSRSRSVTMSNAALGAVASSSSSSRAGAGQAGQNPFERIRGSSLLGMPMGSSSTRYGSLGHEASSSRNRALPPPPQIAEEDECPICHRELPSTSLANHEALREAHIAQCILSHSTYGSPRNALGSNEPPPPPRRTGMYAYPATEKDCVDDAECTICLEEFTVGIPMARLECLCRFHHSCIAAWFVNHPGRCPVHQHDGFGF